MKKLKSIDFKALFINHGEKFGIALILLIVVAVLGSELTSGAWATTDKSPGDLEKKVKEAKDRIEAPSNTWPLAKAEQYAIVDFNGQARDVFTGLSTSKYEFTTPMFWPLYRKKEKAREPEFLAVTYLIADAGVASLSLGKVTETPVMAEEPGASPLDTPSDSNLKPGPGNPTGGPPGMGGPGGPHNSHGGSGLGIRPATVPNSGGSGAAAVPNSGSRSAGPGGRSGGPAARGGSGSHGSSGPHGSSMMSSGEYGGMGPAGGMTAKGKRYVAVRGIVPLKEQIERAMKALNMTYADASAAIEYIDFTLQRQTAVAGPDPWSGEWETVDNEYAVQILRESADYDPDPVPADLQDAVFTMALPYRFLRFWADHATHPNIKNFQLSEAEMQRETMMYEKLLEEAEKLDLQSRPQTVQRKGLSAAVTDLRGISRSVFSSSEGNAVASSMAKYMNDYSGGGANRLGIPDLKSRLSASGRLYLFRYFDFDVQPGMAYRYRVKLQLRNPNFERPYEEVEDQAITKNPTRETGWSNISMPAIVPDTTNYFLKDVERDPVREEKHSKKPVANIAMFEWDANFGTTLADSLKILNVGQFIAEKKKSWVLDPGTPTYEEKEVPFATEDMLVDASGDMEIAPELHPDLQLKPERGRKDVRVGMLPEALVVTGLGQLKELDPISDAKEEKALKQQVEDERKSYLYLRDAPTETRSLLDGPAAGPGGGHGGGGPPSRSNVRKPKGKDGPGGGHGGSSDLPASSTPAPRGRGNMRGPMGRGG